MTPTSYKANILIVDDNDSLRRSMEMILRLKGYAVETAASGAEAIALVQARAFDMIFMDVRMPVLDGVQTLKQIKAIRPQAAVTMMTGYAVEDLIQDALAEGAFALLDKPVEIESFITLIEKARQAQQGQLILIVDDDPAMRDILQRVMAHKGYRVCAAGSGEEAIALAREVTYDILLIDLKLPALNGLETYLAIREFCPQVVAIIFTAYPREMTKLAELVIQSNAYAYLYKPLDMDQLLVLIQEIADKKQRQ